MEDYREGGERAVSTSQGKVLSWVLPKPDSVYTRKLTLIFEPAGFLL